VYAAAQLHSRGWMVGLLERDLQARLGLGSLAAVGGRLEVKNVSDFVFICGRSEVLQARARLWSAISVGLV
jgi:hypothetical protein